MTACIGCRAHMQTAGVRHGLPSMMKVKSGACLLTISTLSAQREESPKMLPRAGCRLSPIATTLEDSTWCRRLGLVGIIRCISVYMVSYHVVVFFSTSFFSPHFHHHSPLQHRLPVLTEVVFESQSLEVKEIFLKLFSKSSGGGNYAFSPS